MSAKRVKAGGRPVCVVWEGMLASPRPKRSGATGIGSTMAAFMHIFSAFLSAAPACLYTFAGVADALCGKLFKWTNWIDHVPYSAEFVT